MAKARASRGGGSAGSRNLRSGDAEPDAEPEPKANEATPTKSSSKAFGGIEQGSHREVSCLPCINAFVGGKTNGICFDRAHGRSERCTRCISHKCEDL
jgi:hypothetical protein